jgi:hypothetical protein
MRFVEVNLAFKGVDLDLLKRKILKQKNLIKRNRAKSRKISAQDKKTYLVGISLPQEDEEETKRQRNRISAQISRDRKKLRVRELEEMNKQLQEECFHRKLENEQLKQSLLAKAKRENQPAASKISKMLIFLGIICLLGLIRDIFLPKDNLPTPIAKITEPLPESPLALKKGLAYLDHFEEKGRMLEMIEAPLVEMFEESMADKLK